eukprot:TRINITY_DN71570_c0_g1_i1.p2 TRINITY_DN71570_c0_g1~~TRINITY_DN71570_c0_g1_i1.p2  ORF type:complete len:131 (+),score=41.79 TRINITY_DN71570_c0_g1_i1:3-395(+)
MTREKLQKMAEVARVGGVRRTHKAARKTTSGEDSKLQQNLKKLGVSQIADIEEVNLIMEDGTVIHFSNPRVQASIQSNTYVVSGNSETKNISDMLPNIIDQLGAESMPQLQELKEKIQGAEKAEEKTEEQ